MSLKTYTGSIDGPENEDQVLVMTTNTQGRHGKGNALLGVQKWGAIYGMSSGWQGQAYGIVTKDLTKRIHPSIDPRTIVEQLKTLYTVANNRPHRDFLVPYKAKGNNLNGYTPEDMAAMFYMNGEKKIPPNMVFEEGFAELIEQLQQRGNEQAKNSNKSSTPEGLA